MTNWHGKARTARQMSVRERAAAAPPSAARALRRAGTTRVHRAVAREFAAAVVGARCDRTAELRAGTAFTRRIDAIVWGTLPHVAESTGGVEAFVAAVACVAHTVAR